ncbi:DMT family transporter [Janthinobacterium sp. 1_2014MBL_MicDiv]|uniref:DMT family transporter n=1 Tax=Janthinobacterium sp. 1_2014MBL_MicDiv TaxID=1644131 RepID=UPI0008F467A6|nr:DMT family transporter [Janthinobacterium sp. 1_2014MBL_MicDiv]APA68237.1 multidrug DMT transporter permease [Janthinobacterium sp. 1_2014MBL_MicDiv]
MWRGIVFGLLAGAFWGAVFIVPALLPDFSPFELMVGRYVCYGALAAGLMLPRLLPLLRRLRRGDWLAMLRQALAGNVVYYLLLAYGVKLAGVAATSLIIGLLPLSVTILGRKDHGALPLRRLAWPLLVVALGIACINLDVFSHDVGVAAGGASLAHKLLGVLCAACALACWTWYALDNARFLKRHAHFSSVEWSMLYGLASGVIALAAGAVALALQQAGEAGGQAVPGRDWPVFWLVCLLLALGASVIGNYLWNMASRLVPVTLSGQLILSETLFALLYGFVYAQRMPRPLEWAAMLLLTAGVLWSVQRHAQQEPERGEGRT